MRLARTAVCFVTAWLIAAWSVGAQTDGDPSTTEGPLVRPASGRPRA